MSAEQDLANANVQIANLIAEVTRFRDAAMGINNIWPTVTDGRNNTADGKYFSVPGDGAYLKLYRRAGTSQTLIAEFPDRSQVQTLIDVLGGRGVLGGSGDLLAKNAWGLGMNGPQADDASNYLSGSLPLGAQANGFRAIVSNEFPSDYPVEAGSWSSVLLNKRNADTGSGLIHSTQNDLYIFRVLSGVVNQVNKLFSNRNVLGPVSIANGMPAGSLFERFSNDDGWGRIAADGLQTVGHKILFQDVAINQSSLGAYVSNSYVINFPRAFKSGGLDAFVPLNIRNSGGPANIRPIVFSTRGSYGSTSMSIAFESPVSLASVNVDMAYIAFGTAQGF